MYWQPVPGTALIMVKQYQVSSHLLIFIYCPWRLAVLHVELCLWQIYLWCVSSTLAPWVSIYQKCWSIACDGGRMFLLNAEQRGRMLTLWKVQAAGIIASKSIYIRQGSVTGGTQCRAGPASKSPPKYKSPWCLNSKDKNECLCVSLEELAILFSQHLAFFFFFFYNLLFATTSSLSWLWIGNS